MVSMNIKPLLSLFWLAAIFAAAEAPVLRAPTGTVVFSTETGAILSVSPSGSQGSVWHSGETGLWSARFADTTTLDAARFHATNTLYAFSWKSGPDKDTLTFTYTCPALIVRVVARPRPDGIELAAEATRIAPLVFSDPFG